MLAALILTAAASATPAHFEGKFQLIYAPIYCRAAPCPPGSYRAVADNVVLGRFKSFTLEDEHGRPLTTLMQDKVDEGDGHAMDGKIDIDEAAGTARIVLSRREAGLWKTPAAAGDQRPGPHKVRIVNATGDVIRGLYLAPVQADLWGPDRLTDNFGIEQTLWFELTAPDCVYDIRIVLGDRPAEEIRRQDICADPTIRADRSGTIVMRK